MSTVFSKNKEKRSRSSPNEASNSFVKNVTSRVSGLLPATITKWFSSPSSTSSANGSAPTAEATDSSTEDEAPESPVTIQPPTKRMRFSSPGKFNHYGPTDTNCTTSNIESVETCNPYNTVQSPLGRATFRRETNYVSTSLRSPNEETTIERSERDSTTFKTQHTLTSIGNSVATKRKSLFGSDSQLNNDTSVKVSEKTTCNMARDPNEPCYKPSLLGSPFYPGRTMYGGAASLYINRPNVTHKKVTLVNDTSNTDDNTISHSARRVMDLLEHYSPLIEAKRLQQFVNSSNNDSFNSTTESSSHANRSLSYKTRELHVPSIASILRLKQRSSRLMDTTNAARQIIASHSSSNSTDYSPYPSSTESNQTDKETNNKLTTKIKTKLTRSKRGESNDLESSTITPVVLPTAVLQIDQDNLPKFTFDSPVTSKVSASPMSKPGFLTVTGTSTSLPMFDSKATTKTTPEKPLSKPETVSNSNLYKFSTPVRISNDSPQGTATPPKFTFGSPERSIDKPKPHENKVDDPSPVIGVSKATESKTSTTSSKDWQCPDCWVNNKSDVDKCVCCGCKKNVKDIDKKAKCSICKLADSQSHVDKCKNCENMQMNNTNKLSITKSTDSSKWKCSDCWVSNEENAEKCICCGAKNSAKSTISPTTQNTSNADSDWKCEDCWIKNKSNINKCAACGATKPGAKSNNNSAVTATSSLFRPPDDTFKDIIKSQQDQWECANCLIRNDSNKTKCICCETEKPGATSESDKRSFNFGKNVNTTFKFGIDPKAQEASLPKQPELKTITEDKSKTEQSETNNNILAKTPTFAFGIPKQHEEKKEPAKESVDGISKLNFSFGIPKQTPSTVTPTFGSENKLSESKSKNVSEKEKPQEVPKVDFTLPKTQDTPKPLTGLFGSPLTSKLSEHKSSTVTVSLLNTSANLENKDVLASNPVTLQSTVTTSEGTPQQKSTFTFSGSGIKPIANLFGSPASTTAKTSISFTSPIQSTPVTSTETLFQKSEPVTTSTISVLQKSDSTVTSTVSLFQTSDATVTTAALPVPTVMSTIFSFGNNTQNAPTQQEKPKFNFTFGSNKTETSSLFKPAFGAVADNNASSSTNKFTFSAGNPLGTGPAISSGSTLGGGNGLPSGNGLNRNSLTSGNGLSTLGGSNGLSTGNTLGSGTGISTGGTGLPSNNSLGGGNNLLATNPLGSGSGIPTNPLSPSGGLPTGNGLQTGSTLSPAPSGGLFGSQVQKENTWSANKFPSNNMFVSNTPTNSMQKPATFTFGTSTPFNANNTTASFGGNAQSTPNIFGISNQNTNNQPSLFPNTVQSPSNIFGSPQPANNPTPSINIFGSPNVGATPTFGTPNPSSIPSFEVNALTPAPAPTFNFGAQQTTGIFGFGQQQQQQQPQQPQQQAGVYNFGGAAGGAPQVHFNMGSAPNTSVRRMRKAVRRNPTR